MQNTSTHTQLNVLARVKQCIKYLIIAYPINKLSQQIRVIDYVVCS